MASSLGPIAEILATRSAIVLDGALATELEARGLDLSSALWSAKILQESPHAIYQVHLDYFNSGADIAITASYQAAPLGLMEHLGMDMEQSQELIRKSVELARHARDAAQGFHRAESQQSKDRKLLIAGSVGPYGAYLADGSEYRGDYTVSQEKLQDFHRPRIQALVDAGVDLLACETLPAFAEIKALSLLLQAEFPTTNAWFSLTLRDPHHLSDGTPLSDVATLLDSNDQVAAVGVNCIPEQDVSTVLDNLRSLTNKPLIVYPNSGEQWNLATETWGGRRTDREEYARLVAGWYEKGARIIGGCCRTRPKDIRVIHHVLSQTPPRKL